MPSSSPGDDLVTSLASSLCPPSQSLTDLAIVFAPSSSSEALVHAPACLGVASWALTPLYLAARRRLAANRRDICAASALLVATPDDATAWAVRKASFAPADADDELRFSALILRRDPKAAAAWAHRGWVLAQVGWEDRAGAELRLAETAAAAKACNYYAGVHRMLALERCGDDQVRAEVLRSRAWMERHVSDCSGWWFHYNAVRRVKEETILAEERAWAEGMQEFHEDYESMRRYCRWLNDL